MSIQSGTPAAPRSTGIPGIAGIPGTPGNPKHVSAPPVLPNTNKRLRYSLLPKQMESSEATLMDPRTLEKITTDGGKLKELEDNEQQLKAMAAQKEAQAKPLIGDDLGEEQSSQHLLLKSTQAGCCGLRRKAKSKHVSYNNFDLETARDELIACCLTHMQDTYKVHLNRLRGLEIITMIVAKADKKEISSVTAVHLTWSCLSCIHHFLLRLNTVYGPMQWTRRRQAKKSVICYEKMLRFLLPEKYTIVLNAVVTFFEEANLWDIEYLCSSLLKRLFYHTDNFGAALEDILSLAENSTLTNGSASRQIINIIYDIEERSHWTLISEPLLCRLLEMYYKSVTPDLNTDYSYDLLETGLEMCLRTMANYFLSGELLFVLRFLLTRATLEEITEDHLLEFSSLLEYTGYMYKTASSSCSLNDHLFPELLELIGSDNLLYSLLGNRLLHQLIDRNGNKSKFDTPRIYFKEVQYDIKLNTFSDGDRDFFRRYRETLHSTILTSVIKHGFIKVHLENIYLTVALILVEIPCGYTAAAAICLTMELQEHALTDGIDLISAHRIHATVLSVMSLVAYIHKADIFYDYIISIMERRAKYAPHLNPPLRTNYKYAQHHILWNNPELFFEDWELRYGLWKCFKSKLKKRKGK